MKHLLCILPFSAILLMAADGASLYQKCASCHGKNGETPAMGKSTVIAGWDAAKTEEALRGYAAGTRNVNGMGGVMKNFVKDYSDAEFKAVSEYVAGLK